LAVGTNFHERPAVMDVTVAPDPSFQLASADTPPWSRSTRSTPSVLTA